MILFRLVAVHGDIKVLLIIPLFSGDLPRLDRAGLGGDIHSDLDESSPRCRACRGVTVGRFDRLCDQFRD